MHAFFAHPQACGALRVPEPFATKLVENEFAAGADGVELRAQDVLAHMLTSHSMLSTALRTSASLAYRSTFSPPSRPRAPASSPVSLQRHDPRIYIDAIGLWHHARNLTICSVLVHVHWCVCVWLSCCVLQWHARLILQWNLLS
jgi:hypothetical protein